MKGQTEVKKAEQRNKERVPLTAMLVIGEDDDLIEWLRSLPEGGRQRALRAVLRAGLGLADFDTKPMPAVEVAGIDRAAQQRIAELEHTLRQQNEQIGLQNKEIGTLQQWMTYFDQKFQQLESYGDVTQVAHPIEVTDQVEPERLAARVNRLKQQKW